MKTRHKMYIKNTIFNQTTRALSNETNTIRHENIFMLKLCLATFK